MRTNKKSSDAVDISFQRINQKWQIVISDSSSESEVEDPLMPVLYKDMKMGGAQGVTSSLQYQYCDSSEDGASPSDDDIPPLPTKLAVNEQEPPHPHSKLNFPPLKI
ncbi:MAG: hypothetical protein MJE68_14550 [Proteobacteria bacterium]|nr:hypothetical protein [Pseudomonadota bacterium]